jgi:2-methylcitrate dehydratase PrpD
MDDITKRLASFIAGLKFEDLPAPVVEQTKKCLLDYTGVALYGARTPIASKFFNFIRRFGGVPEATVIRYGHRTTCPQAALVNGYMAHGLELDDGHIVGHVHPGVTAIPAALAVGEKMGVSGKDFITAVVAGYETVIRVGDAITPSAIYDRGIHAPGLTGAFGAAAAVGSLLGLNRDQMTHAIGNCCLTPVSPFQTFTEGATIKDLYGGWPGFVGTLAALMAQDGFTGPEKLFEGSKGFCRNVADEYDVTKIVQNLGEQWRILETYFKKHASCSFSHTTMDAVMEIVESQPVAADDIETVLVKTHRFASDLDEKRPQTLSAKKSSIPYCTALAIVKKRVFLDEFNLKPGEEASVLSLAEKVGVCKDPELDRVHVADEGRRPASVEICLKNGDLLSARKDVAKGWPEDPLSDSEFEEKFNRLVREAVSETEADGIRQTLKTLETLPDISGFIQQLVSM